MRPFEVDQPDERAVWGQTKTLLGVASPCVSTLVDEGGSWV